MVALERDLAPPPAPVSADAIPLALRRRGGTSRQALAMAVVGSLVLAVFAASDLPVWAERLGDGPVGAPVRELALAWSRATASVGLDRPHQAIRDAIGRALDWRW